MTREDIIRMAREAGWMHEHDSETGFVAEAAIKFAALVAAHVRETEHKPWVGLTYGEVLEQKKDDPIQFYRAIEAKLKEKNT